MKRATTPEQKREIIERLYKVWCDNEDLRLGQMIDNVIDGPEAECDFFYLEDEDLLQLLEDKYRYSIEQNL